MLLMTRSAKNKQRRPPQMRDEMQPGSGVRTIGGMYAIVKEVHDDDRPAGGRPRRARHLRQERHRRGAREEEYNRIVDGATRSTATSRSSRTTRPSLTGAAADETGDEADKIDLRQDRGRGRRAAADEPRPRSQDAEADEDAAKATRTPQGREEGRRRRASSPAPEPRSTLVVVHRGSGTV